jgi:hypothetical protein
LGIFLAIALGIFFLVRQILFGPMPRRSWLYLGAAAILFVFSLILVFFPYLNGETSFSNVTETKSIAPSSFSTPVSFYSNWSYLLLFFKRIFWNQSPLSPGLSVFIFFLLAFAPYIENAWQKTMALSCSFFLIVPALALPIIYNGLPLEALNRICGWTLSLFLLGLSLLLASLRRKIPRELLLLTVTWILLQFYSSQISLPFFNLFQGLARLFPPLLRSRGIHTEYIVVLLFLSIAAFGMSYFFKRFRKKKVVLALALLLVFAERIRWPVYPERLDDDRPLYGKFYESIARYPDHFGLLELPFYPQSSNHYPLFTILHNKHTYHGHIFYLSDYYELNNSPQLQAASGFSGLSDASFTQSLKAKGIRLIMLFKNKICADPENGQKTWHVLQNRVRAGESRGLFEKVETTPTGILLALSEREQGAKIRYFIPHYALRNKENIICTIEANKEKEAEFIFNEKPFTRLKLQPQTQSRIVIDLKSLTLASQFNYLEIRSGPSLELIKVRIE